MSVLRRGIALSLMVSVVALYGCVDQNNGQGESSADEHYPIVTLEQGWSASERVDFYTTSQGSQLMPFAWFLALEKPGSDDLFRDNEDIRRLGSCPRNP